MKALTYREIEDLRIGDQVFMSYSHLRTYVFENLLKLHHECHKGIEFPHQTEETFIL